MSCGVCISARPPANLHLGFDVRKLSILSIDAISSGARDLAVSDFSPLALNDKGETIYGQLLDFDRETDGNFLIRLKSHFPKDFRATVICS
jgi:hypothetical protein